MLNNYIPRYILLLSKPAFYEVEVSFIEKVVLLTLKHHSTIAQKTFLYDFYSDFPHINSVVRMN